MTFLNPILLYIGLGCIAIPIIVHLLTRRRRKPIVWAAMRFLLEAYKKHRRRLTLEQLLLLATRCLLVALLALALGKPVLGAAGLLGGSGPRTLYLIVDNSLTGTALGADGKPALDLHKAAGARLLARLDQSKGDRAALLALGAPAQTIVVPPSNDLAGVGRALESLTGTDSRADLPGVLARIRADLEDGASETGAISRTSLAILSAWRSGSADTDRALPAVSNASAPERVQVLATAPTDVPVENTAIVQAEPLRAMLLSGNAPDEQTAEAAGASTQIRVTLRRFGPGIAGAGATQLSARVVRADGPSEPGARTVVRWSPGQEEATEPIAVQLPGGATSPLLALVVEIDRDAIAGDNVCYRPIEARPNVQVGLLSPPSFESPGSVDRFGPSDRLRLALQPEGVDTRAVAAVRVIDIDPRTVGQVGVLSGLDAVLIPSPEMLDTGAWSKVGEFCRQGGLVMVMPGAELTVHLWADAFVAALGLDWTIAREARSFAAPVELSDRGASPGTDLLAMLSGELAELAKPVRVSRILPVEVGGRSAEVLLQLADSTPLLIAGAPGAADKSVPSRGMVVLLAVAPDLKWSDLPTKPLMLPLVQETVRQGIGRARGVWTAVAGGRPAAPPGTVELQPLQPLASAAASEEVVLVSDTAGGAFARRAGLWRATDARGATVGLAAVNADLGASRTSPRSTAELSPWLASIAGEDRLTWAPDLGAQPAGQAPPGPTILADDPRPPVSPILLAVAACVAMLELALARWFSHAAIDHAVQVPAGGKS